MGQVEVHQEVVVEEVAEGTVADVVQQAGHPQQLLDQRRRRRVGKHRAERRVELLGEAAGQVHGAQGVLEAAVLGGREHPARRLQLRDAPQPLHPRRVDQILLGRLAGHAARARVEDVLMDGVGDEPAALVGVGGALHEPEFISRKRTVQPIAIDRADADDLARRRRGGRVTSMVSPAWPAPELLVELLLRGDVHAVDPHDQIAAAEAGGSRGARFVEAVHHHATAARPSCRARARAAAAGSPPGRPS